jgi:sulfur carrier protein
VRLNGETVATFDGSVSEFIDSLDVRREGIAVAIDGEIIPRSQWRVTKIGADAIIEIVTAAAGG